MWGHRKLRLCGTDGTAAKWSDKLMGPGCVIQYRPSAEFKKVVLKNLSCPRKLRLHKAASIKRRVGGFFHRRFLILRGGLSMAVVQACSITRPLRCLHPRHL